MSSFESFLVYTTETGGRLHTQWATRSRYEDAKATGKLWVTHLDGTREELTLKMVAFAPRDDLRDFVLDPV